MIISLIVAVDEQLGIGKNNRLPWHLHTDLARFKRLTMGHYLAVGRKTYESIGKPLPGRIMIVITHDGSYHPEGCQVAYSIGEAISLAIEGHETELFIIGGGEIFEQALSFADKIYLTIVHTKVVADVYFPPLEDAIWELVHTEKTPPNDKDEYPSDFRIYIRKPQIQVDKTTNSHIIGQNL